MKLCKLCKGPVSAGADGAQCTNCRKHRATDKAIESAVSAGGLEPFAGNRLGYVEAILARGSVGGAAHALGIEPRELRAEMHDIMHAAARRGVSPADDKAGTAPIGYHTKGKSILYKIDRQTGERVAALEWHKTQADKEQEIAELLDAVRAGLTDLPSSPSVFPLVNHDEYGAKADDLLTVYPMGDPHLGMLAWPAETGNAFDLTIAERDLYAAVDYLVSKAPPSREALIINLGDFFHADNKLGTTFAGTKLDTDGRWAKVLALGIKLMRRCIDRALEKHERVTVISEIGNHDTHTSVVLAVALAQFYETNPRVTIDTSPAPHHWYRFGKVLIGTHHGDRTKRENLKDVMTVDQRKAWGESEFCYWYIGHVHHDTLKELAGCTVESFRTLAGKDDWHNGKGYRSGRDMKLIVHHREYGEVGRYVANLALIHAVMEHRSES